MTATAVDRRAQFERARLDLFTTQGFDGDVTRIAHADGRETYALVRGIGPSPTILLHGGVTAAEEWSGIAAQLSGQLVIPDRPGNGLSSPVGYRGVDLRAKAASWLNGVVDALGIDTINVIGCSMGGFFAMAFATAHPERVRRLILTGSAPGVFYRFPLFYHLLASPVIGRRITGMTFRDREVFRKRIYGPLVVHPDRIPDALLDVTRTAFELPGASDTRYSELRSLVTTRGLRPEFRMRDDLAVLNAMTLFVWGPHDHLAGPEVADDLVRRMDRAQLALIEDAGHIPHFDQPDRVAEAINAFLA
jgi:pimeloyl-ACP methyl ester carboxylesterase